MNLSLSARNYWCDWCDVRAENWKKYESETVTAFSLKDRTAASDDIIEDFTCISRLLFL